MSWDWSCWWIQSVALWNHTACYKTMILSISCIWAWGNLHWEMRLQMSTDSACTSLPQCCLMLDSSSSQKAQKCSLDLIDVPIASRAHQGIFMLSSMMMPLSMRDWTACLSSPSNMSFSCFQPLQQSSASSVPVSRASS